MTVTVETGLWQLDPTASTVAVRHKSVWGLVTVRGTFTGVTGRGERGQQRGGDYAADGVLGPVDPVVKALIEPMVQRAALTQACNEAWLLLGALFLLSLLLLPAMRQKRF